MHKIQHVYIKQAQLKNSVTQSPREDLLCLRFQLFELKRISAERTLEFNHLHRDFFHAC